MQKQLIPKTAFVDIDHTHFKSKSSYAKKNTYAPVTTSIQVLLAQRNEKKNYRKKIHCFPKTAAIGKIFSTIFFKMNTVVIKIMHV